VVTVYALPAAAEIPAVFVGGDIDSALAAAKQKDTAVLVYIYLEMDNALPAATGGTTRTPAKAKSELCRRIEDQVLRSPIVLKALEPLVCVAIRVEQDMSIFARLKLEPAFPTFAWLDTDGELLATFGACFSPQAYADITARALEMRRLLAQRNLDASTQADLGRMFFDNAVYSRAQGVLEKLVTSDQADRSTRIVYAFALRALKRNAESLAALAPALGGILARDASDDETRKVANGPVVGWTPVVFEKDGKLAGMFYNVSSAKALVDEIDSLEWAIAATPSSTAEKLRGARVLHRRENWPAAAAAYEVALEGKGLSSAEEEECAARSATDALLAGDSETAGVRFDRYLKNGYKGPSRPDVCFYAGSLYLARSVELTGDKKDPKYNVKDKDQYRRAAELLAEVQRDFPESPFQPLAEELLSEFFDEKVLERPGGGDGRTGRDGGGGEDRPPVGPNRGR
jgi:hypothetical protein